MTTTLLVGVSAATRRAITVARRVAPTGVPVMITGEPGTGKRALARFIHAESRRTDRPFASVNCAETPEPQLEGELFGQIGDAATDTPARPGALETAAGGTVFLEEVTTLPQTLQTRLLAAIEQAETHRLRSHEDVTTPHPRFIAASSRDMRAAVDTGQFQKRLYYRLAVVPIALPPLRHRPEDVPVLANSFLAQHWARHRQGEGSAPTLADATLDSLRERSWLGNIAELRNFIEHVAALAEPGSCIQPDDIPPSDEPIRALAEGYFPLTIIENAYHKAKDTVVALFEKAYLLHVLERALGNIAEAARLAAIDRATLYRLIDKHGLRRVGAPEFRAFSSADRDSASGDGGSGEAGGSNDQEQAAGGRRDGEGNVLQR